jgi:hypothetical protein
LGDLLGRSARYTKGSISATTGIRDDPKELQVSAQIQPGSSGSPLFDGEGVVIGVMQSSLDHLRLARAIGGHLPQNVNFAIKSGVALEFLRTDKAVHDMLSYDLGRGVENLQESVVRVRSGNFSEEWEKTPKLYAVVYYRSIWDIWHRFTHFVIKVYDLDSGQPLFAVGQDRDNKRSTEDFVIRETFAEVRKALRKDQQ